MNDPLNRWLDGEIDRDELPPELREQAELWERLHGVRRTDVGPAPPWLVEGVMREVAAARPGPLGRGLEALAWLTRPRAVRVRPLSVLALAAAALALLLFRPPTPGVDGPSQTSTGTAAASRAAGDDSTLPGSPTGETDGRVYVQFVYVAPEASSVTLAGDFNEWNDQRLPLRDPDGDGVWTGYVLLEPGLHKYMFVVDGGWVTDPRAERHVDDGFGNRNALITVMAPGSRI